MKVFHVEREFQGTYTQRRTRTPYLVVHHAAATYTQLKTGRAIVENICDYHTKTRGWPGGGYHEIIVESVPGGPLECYVLSDPMLQRAGVLQQNHVIYSICLATNFDDEKVHPGKVPGAKWVDAAVERIKAARLLFPTAEIVGHKEITVAGGATACPGTKWAEWKPELLRQVAAQDAGLEVLGPPRISERQFVTVLSRENPGLTPSASAIYHLIKDTGVDPAIGLAFFAHESSYGREGICKTFGTKNWGNVRTAHSPALASGSTAAGGRGPFATYASWENGAKDWALRIKEAYVGARGLRTVEAITPVYAPATDNNNPGSYARKVGELVKSYQAVPDGLDIGGIKIDPAFEEAYKLSGGADWVAGKLIPGLPLESASLFDEKLHQLFERGALRRNADGSIDWLFTAEIAALKAKRLELLQNL